MDPQVICPHCKGNATIFDYFCPNCGKKLKEKLLSTTLTSQILIYLLSALLPPLGLWPAIKYLRQNDEKSKKIGITAIILTIISIVITIWVGAGFINSLTKSLSGQLNMLDGLGY